jgi:hypothetical protein
MKFSTAIATRTTDCDGNAGNNAAFRSVRAGANTARAANAPDKSTFTGFHRIPYILRVERLNGTITRHHQLLCWWGREQMEGRATATKRVLP